jgi:hypothetical protein
MAERERLSRRDFLRAGAAITVAGALGRQRAFAAEAGPEKLTFAVFTDSHYADREPAGSRFYRDSAEKLAEGIKTVNEATPAPAFAIMLGDYVDKRGGAREKAADLKTIEAVFAKFKGPRHYVLGNHDVDVFTKEQFIAGTGMPAPNYAFDAGAFRCIVLDADFKKDFSPYRAGNFSWVDTWVPPDEQKWLKAALDGAKGKAIIFAHQCLDDEKRADGVKNGQDVRRILEESGKVVAVFQGHNHAGGFHEIKGIPYFTQKAMVEGQGLKNNAYALATVSPDGTYNVHNYGREEGVRFRSLL